MGATKSSLALSEHEIDTGSIPLLDDQYGPQFVTQPRECACYEFDEAESTWKSTGSGQDENKAGILPSSSFSVDLDNTSSGTNSGASTITTISSVLDNTSLFATDTTTDTSSTDTTSIATDTIPDTSSINAAAVAADTFVTTMTSTTTPSTNTTASSSISLCTAMPSSISCVSYNIWFAQSFQKERAIALAQLLETLKPHIICLVEVRQEPLQFLMSLNWVQQNYFLSTNTIPLGGALILSHKVLLPRPLFMHHTWPTNMPRIFLTAKFEVQASVINNSFAVGCVHLESMSSQPMREGQLRVCSQVLRSAKRALLMGDFNISEKKEENCSIERMLPFYTDVWRLLYKKNPGFTRDTVKNTMVSGATVKRFRIDRIMCKSSKEQVQLVPRSIKIVGNAKFGNLPNDRGITQDVFISDHFGLFATFGLEHAEKT